MTASFKPGARVEQEPAEPLGSRSIEAYLESDAPSRASRFPEFQAELRAIRDGGGCGAASEFARRAITPKLDLTSLRSLLKFRAPDRSQDRALRLAVLGGPTTAPLVPCMQAFLWAERMEAEIYEGAYGLFRQELLTAGSGLDRFGPELIFLATDRRDLANPPVDAGPRQMEEFARAEVAGWTGLWERARERWNATVIQNTFADTGYPVFGHLAHRIASSPEAYSAVVNRMLYEAAGPHVVFHDLRLLVHEAGARQWFDPRFYVEAKLPCAPECMVPYGYSVASLVRALRGRSKKVLTLDLDNTLWGGVIGDAGVDGIEMGEGSGLGESFLALQRYAKALYDRGVVLAVCSKNDASQARAPFEKRPDMALRLDQISCFLANWEDKPTNLRRIAEALGLGLDSFVFVDDNPAERALVRRTLPEVAVPDLPEDPAEYVPTIASYRYFETVSFTQEDAMRSQYYKHNAALRSLAAGARDLNGFLDSLEMVARVEPVTSANRLRVTQLLNKTNQFNLTTRRYTETEIQRIAESRDWSTCTISLRDRLGDHGLISILLFEEKDGELEIDTWLMSCRVLQRGVEDFALGEAVRIARERGCRALVGRYLPTARNEMVREHYGRLGFECTGQTDGATTWRMDLAGRESSFPSFRIRKEEPL